MIHGITIAALCIAAATAEHPALENLETRIAAELAQTRGAAQFSIQLHSSGLQWLGLEPEAVPGATLKIDYMWDQGNDVWEIIVHHADGTPMQHLCCNGAQMDTGKWVDSVQRTRFDSGWLDIPAEALSSAWPYYVVTTQHLFPMTFGQAMDTQFWYNQNAFFPPESTESTLAYHIELGTTVSEVSNSGKIRPSVPTPNPKYSAVGRASLDTFITKLRFTEGLPSSWGIINPAQPQFWAGQVVPNKDKMVSLTWDHYTEVQGFSVPRTCRVQGYDNAQGTYVSLWETTLDVESLTLNASTTRQPACTVVPRNQRSPYAKWDPPWYKKALRAIQGLW